MVLNKYKNGMMSVLGIFCYEEEEEEEDRPETSVLEPIHADQEG